MKKLSIKIILSIALMFSLVSCSSDSVDKMAIDPDKVTVNYNYSENETELASLINDYRASIGLNKLELMNYVSVKSEEHDLYMIQNDDVSHAGFKERADIIMQTLRAKKVSENIAYNYLTSQSALTAWLCSSGHKANIEGDFTHFGISIRINPMTGKKYYTNIFIKK
jgi:uncharacterized protein YkwD